MSLNPDKEATILIRGFYTAASSMHTQEKRLSVIANNLANVNTTGFRRDGVVTGTFGEYVAARMNTYQFMPAQDIGPATLMTTLVEEFTSFDQGAFEFVQNPYYMAVRGDGFFVIDIGGTGEMGLTRNGQFALDDEGFLILPNMGRVQGEGGDIQLGNHRFMVSLDGMIFLEDMETGETDEVDRILIVMPMGEREDFKKDTNEMFTAAAGFTQVDPMSRDTSVMQNALERSNVNIADEMADMIAAQRTLQASSQILRMFDDMADQGNNRISRTQ